MDKTTDQLVSYARSMTTSVLTESVRAAAVTRVVDSIGCAVVGSTAAPARIAVEAARGTTCDRPATVLGARLATTPELAAFANTTMVRTFDWNDGMLAKGGGHPSDMIPAVLAVAETEHLDGEQVLFAITLAYELLGALGNSAPVRDRGWDQGTFMGASAALAIGRMLDLSEDELANAVSLAVVPHAPLRVNRTGLLSMWKGSATASAMHSAIFAVRLARLGMTGPDEPFDGRTALKDQVTGPFDVSLPAHPDGPMVVELSHLKSFPAETHAQALLGLIPTLSAWRPVDDIASIEIQTYWQAWHEIAMHPSKWDPTTRETADHSLPYLLAVALVDGTVDVNRSFTPERIADPALRPVMRRITVTEDPAFTAVFRPPGAGISGQPRARLVAVATDGARFVEEVGYHRGHARNPMTRADVDAKFDLASAGVVDNATRDRIRDAWWDVANARDIAETLSVTSDFTGAAQ